MVEVSASILSVKKEKAIQTLYNLETAKIDYFHIDAMDGKFVKNNTIDQMLEYCECLNSISNLPLDIHLMVEDVKNYFYSFLVFEPNIVTFHVEAAKSKEEVMEWIKLIKENNVVMAYGELFNMESEFWISILAEIEKPILCISAEADWNYNGEEIAQHVQNENVKFKILPDVDATMRLGFRNHLAANNLTYMGYLNRKGVTKPEDGKDIPCYAEDIGKCIMEYMEHLQ